MNALPSSTHSTSAETVGESTSNPEVHRSNPARSSGSSQYVAESRCIAATRCSSDGGRVAGAFGFWVWFWLSFGD